jgi:ankyrin repeat protein
MQARHLFRDIFQSYLFFSASKRDHIEVVKEFLNHNADIEAKDNDEKTALIMGIVLY